MATATATPRMRPVRDANFLPRRERKRVRKSMIRAALANYVADKRVGYSDRVQFYRELRFKKMRRMAIAKAMMQLTIAVDGLHQQVRRVEDRHQFGSAKTAAEKQIANLIDESLDNCRMAAAAIQAAAEEWHAFSRRKIYYTEAV